MNENLGINMSPYLEWNILLAVLALFGNFPYGPPLSPNGIWDSFVSLSVSLTHQQHKVVYTGGNFLCNGCIGKCVCGNWGLGKKFDSLWHTKAHSNRIGTHMLAAKAHAVTCAQHTHSNVAQLCFFVEKWVDSNLLIREARAFALREHENIYAIQPIMFSKAIHLAYYITKGLLRCNGSPNVNLAKQDFEVMPGTLEMLL